MTIRGNRLLRWPLLSPGATYVCLSCFLLALALGCLALAQPPYTDLGVYRMGGQAAADHTGIYDRGYVVLGLPFTYPPFAALAFTPLARADLSLLGLLWSALSGLALARSAWLLLRTARPDAAAGWVLRAALVLEAGALLTDPYTQTLKLGQINLLLMWLILEDTFGLVPASMKGFLTGVATGIKLTPGAFILFALLRGDRRQALQGVVGAVATAAIGFLVLPRDSVRYWFGGVFVNAPRIGNLEYAGNQSLPGALARLAPDAPGWLGPASSILLLGVTLLCSVWLWRRARRLGALATVAIGSLLASPISWSHHWVWLIVAVAAGFERPARSPARGGFLVAVLAVGLLRVIWWGPVDHGREVSAPLWAKLATDGYVLLGLWWLGAAAWVVARSAARRRAAGGSRASAAREPPAAEVSSRCRTG